MRLDRHPSLRNGQGIPSRPASVMSRGRRNDDYDEDDDDDDDDEDDNDETDEESDEDSDEQTDDEEEDEEEEEEDRGRGRGLSALKRRVSNVGASLLHRRESKSATPSTRTGGSAPTSSLGSPAAVPLPRNQSFNSGGIPRPSGAGLKRNPSSLGKPALPTPSPQKEEEFQVGRLFQWNIKCLIIDEMKTGIHIKRWSS